MRDNSKNWCATRASVFLLFALTLWSPLTVYAEPTSESIPSQTESDATVAARSADGEQVVEETIAPATDEVVGARHVIHTARGEFEIADSPPTELAKQKLATMSEAEIKIFNERRVDFLKRAAQALSTTRLALGTGLYVKNKLVRLIPSKKEREPMKSIKEYGEGLVQTMLTKMSTQIWEHAPIIATANEFNVVLSGNTKTALAFGSRGFHEGLGLGVSIGYNAEQKSVGFQVFAYQERLHRALPYSVGVSVHGKFFGQAMNREPGTEGKTFHAIYTSLPGPMGVADTSNSFEGGLTWGVGAQLPSIMFQAKMYRYPILDVNVANRPGYVRTGGLIGGPVNMAFAGVTQLTKYLAAKAASAGSKVACWLGFSGLRGGGPPSGGATGSPPVAKL